MKLLCSSISSISKSTKLLYPPYLAFFKQLKIMLIAIAKSCTDYALRFLIHNYLAFKCMPFLFPRVKMLLPIVTMFYPFLISDFFLGRSIGVSDASIRITSYSILLLRSAFFPGSENSLLVRDFAIDYTMICLSS